MGRRLGDIEELVGEVEAEMIRWRRHLHQYPELSFQEIQTSKYIYERLQSFGNLEVMFVTPTSVMARLTGRQTGKVIGLRADMDALPIQEETGLLFASKNPGVMHACGHDGHTAMLLAAAKILSQLKDEIKGEIRFFFQHAEELFPGGASEMVKAGVTEGVDAILGLHLASQLPIGAFGISYGAATAACDMFDITIHGKGGHGASPHKSVDPIMIGTQVVNGINQLISRKVNPSERAVISVTQFHGGSANNIIPDKVTIGGSVRTFDSDIRRQIPIWIEQITKALTEGNDASYELDYHLGYGTVTNEERITSMVEKVIIEAFGEDNLIIAQGSMVSEDFSAFTDAIPGCFVFLGAGSANPNENFPHHHPQFDVQEGAFAFGVVYFVRSALAFLDS